MRPAEHLVNREASYFYVHVPSDDARSAYLHPLRAGLFVYGPGYEIDRSSFDSFLLMHVEDGELLFRGAAGEGSAPAGSFVLMDCYGAHAYSAPSGATVRWVHFDGVGARELVSLAVRRRGPCLPESSCHGVADALRRVVDSLSGDALMTEGMMCRCLHDMLMGLVDSDQLPVVDRDPSAIDDAISYMMAHLSERLTVARLADRAYMSECHFIKQFKAQTGCTPHAYLVRARIQMAQYMLATTDQSVSDIGVLCGMSDPTVFSSTFRRQTGMSPRAYRLTSRQS